MWTIWCLFLFVAFSQGDWMLHTPGGGLLEERCPCMAKSLCPRVFGTSKSDILHMGNLPICMDSREIRCCGVSKSMMMIVQSKHMHIMDIGTNNNFIKKEKLNAADQETNETRNTPYNMEESYMKNMFVRNNTDHRPNEKFDHELTQREKKIQTEEHVNQNSTNKHHVTIRITDRLRNYTKYLQTENRRKNISVDIFVQENNINKTPTHIRTINNRVKISPMASKIISAENIRLIWQDRTKNKEINHNIKFSQAPHIHMQNFLLPQDTTTEKKLSNCDTNSTCVFLKLNTNETDEYKDNKDIENVPDNEFAESNVSNFFKHFQPQQNITSMFHKNITPINKDTSIINMISLMGSTPINFAVPDTVHNKSEVYINGTKVVQPEQSGHNVSKHNTSHTTETFDNSNRKQQFQSVTADNKTHMPIKNSYVKENISSRLFVNSTHSLDMSNGTHNQKNDSLKPFIVYPSKQGHSDTLSLIPKRENRNIFYVLPESMTSNISDSEEKPSLTVIANEANGTDDLNTILKDREIAKLGFEEVNRESKDGPPNKGIDVKHYEKLNEEEIESSALEKRDVMKYTANEIFQFQNKYSNDNVTPAVGQLPVRLESTTETKNDFSEHYMKLNPVTKNIPITRISAALMNNKNQEKQIRNKEIENSSYTNLRDDTTHEEVDEEHEYYNNQIMKQSIELFKLHPMSEQKLNKSVQSNIAVSNVKSDVYKGRFVRKRHSMTDSRSVKGGDNTEVEIAFTKTKENLGTGNLPFLIQSKYNTNSCLRNGVAGRISDSPSVTTDNKENIQQKMIYIRKTYETTSIASLPLTNFRKNFIKAKVNNSNFMQNENNSSMYKSQTSEFIRNTDDHTTKKDINTKNTEDHTNKREINTKMTNPNEANGIQPATTSTADVCLERCMFSSEDIKAEKTVEKEIDLNKLEKLTDSNYLIYIINPLYYLPYENSEYNFNELADNLSSVKETEIEKPLLVKNISNTENGKQSFPEITTPHSSANSSEIITLSTQNYSPQLYLPYENSTLNFNTKI